MEARTLRAGLVSLPRPSDHLLRTFAAVPLPETVLVAGDDALRHALPLARLGFDVTACAHRPAAADACRAALAAHDVGVPTYAMPPDDLAFADGAFGWIVATDLALPHELAHLRRVLRPGGWLFAEATADAACLTRAFVDARFAVAEAAGHAVEPGRTQGIFRRIDGGAGD